MDFKRRRWPNKINCFTIDRMSMIMQANFLNRNCCKNSNTYMFVKLFRWHVLLIKKKLWCWWCNLIKYYQHRSKGEYDMCNPIQILFQYTWCLIHLYRRHFWFEIIKMDQVFFYSAITIWFTSQFHRDAVIICPKKTILTIFTYFSAHEEGT